MKTKKLLMLSLSMLFVGTTMASCGNNANNDNDNEDKIVLTISGPTSVEVGASIRLAIDITNDDNREGYVLESSDTSIATVTQEGLVTGVDVGTVTITATSRADDSVSKTYVIDVTESTIPTLEIKATSASTSIYGSIMLTAEVNNPNNLDVTYKWSLRYGKGTLIGNKNKEQEFIGLSSGDDVVELEVCVGPYVLKTSKHIYVGQDYAGWTAISTKTELLDLVNKTGDYAGNYYLSDDIDLEGEIIAFNAARGKFSGTLDGRGHKISNYKVHGNPSDEAYGSAGLFKEISGAVKNLAIECEIPEEGSGWGSGALAASITGTVENCSFYVNHTFNNGLWEEKYEGWRPACSAISGMMEGLVRDVVVQVEDNEGKHTIYADVAYPTGGTGATDKYNQGVFTNFYTNQAASNVGGEDWDWGVRKPDLSGYSVNIDFENTKASFYDLNEYLWNLYDNQVPTLKNI